ncbi:MULTISPECIES: SDR family NAD(P)-dependent oxidoreductase [unclassified Mesorhizobium]|uniref:SDR family NAD(P)-dependent oxidoreductase n=1 Tax=unclassified Mesorhizobium TaxID=325217 RepID=UPI002484A8EF|nr:MULTISPECIES: SDR family NAD(P)-dependent oxidoreductase [unclassified Mesorhizobium]
MPIPVALENLLRLNSLAPTVLTAAVLPGVLNHGNGSIINIASVLAHLPEYSHGIYAATKSYLLTMSQSLHAEVGRSASHRPRIRRTLCNVSTIPGSAAAPRRNGS